jgi:hypothetical protein
MRRAAAAVALLAALAGCGEDETIRVYTAPKEPAWRMVAAVVPAGGATWFFKLVALAPRIEPLKAEVDRFLDGLKVEGDKVKWTLPEGWHEEGAPQGDRITTLCIGKSHLEMTVTRLDGPAGGLLANLNRWRGQLGLEPFAEAELAAQSRSVDVGGGAKAVVVDFRGPKKPPSGPMMGGGAASRPAPPPDHGSGGGGLEEVRRLIAYTAPSGWTENPRPAPPRLLEFRAGEAVVSLAYLEGNGGGLGPNINRWRGQIGLPALDDAAAAASAQPFEFMGHPGQAVEIVGDARAMMNIFRLGPPFSLFLKIDGPKEAVLREKPAFEAFARSVRVNR